MAGPKGKAGSRKTGPPHELKPGSREQGFAHRKAICMGDPFDMTRQCGWKSRRGTKHGKKEPQALRKGDTRKSNQYLTTEIPEEQTQYPSEIIGALQNATLRNGEHTHKKTHFGYIHNSTGFTGPGGHPPPAGHGFQFALLERQVSPPPSRPSLLAIFFIPIIVFVIAILAIAGALKLRQKSKRQYRRLSKRPLTVRDEENVPIKVIDC